MDLQGKGLLYRRRATRRVCADAGSNPAPDATMVENLLGSEVVMNLGTGAVLGFISGYAAKIVTKIVAVVAGLSILFVKWLESQGLVNIDWVSLGGGVVKFGGQAASGAPSLADQIVSTMGLGGGFAAGFYLGFRRG
ncbi:MAG: FUN14 domain-containing protein [Candidatus Nanohaloarchaea archaeon]|nr:FUN14 domain-containing protein [Candidatus Nanohaloarchaea archaeon]